MTEEMVDKLFSRPNVDVSVVVSAFTGKLLGTVQDSSCSFSEECPLDGQCPCVNSKTAEQGLAILIPPHPHDKVTRKNLTRCHCRLYDEHLVSAPIIGQPSPPG